MVRDAQEPRDAHSRFRCWMGPSRVLVDRRAWWVHEDRELVAYNQISRGERRARGRFWRAIADGMDPADAVAHAVELRAGPIPELQSRKQFAAFWTKPRLTQTAERWKKSHHCPRYAQSQVRNTQQNFLAELPDLGKTLLAIAKDPKQTGHARVAAIRAVMDRCGADITQEDPASAKSLELPEITPENAQLLERKLLEIAASEKDTNRARLLTEQIRWLLAKVMPEKYGEKIDVNMTHTVDLKAALAAGNRRAEAVIEAHAVRQLTKLTPSGDDQ